MQRAASCRLLFLEVTLVQTIAAISTPNAHGGIGVIRISGDNAIAIADKAFRSAGGKKPSDMAGYTCAYGNIVDRNNIVIDDIVLTVFRAPHSYTGEDVVEISCHGGIYICKKIISLLFEHGAVPAEAGEFSKRAFLNGKMSLSQAEAVMNAIHAQGEAALREANMARSGRLAAQMRASRTTITELLSAICYWMDDPEETPPELEQGHLTAQINAVAEQLRALSQRYDNGRILREGIRTVLMGAPNAGKSSVMNWLAGINRSIVTDIPGTTRDVITEHIRLGEFTLLLSDTAGLRDTDDAIEAMGVDAAYRQADEAELILYVVDGAVGLCDADRCFLAENAHRRLILLYNKSDIARPPARLPAKHCVVCSAKTGEGFDALTKVLEAMFCSGADIHQPSLVSERQKLLVDRALGCLLQAVSEIDGGYPLDVAYVSLESAANYLAQFDGEVVTDDVIDGVFSRFCVGK